MLVRLGRSTTMHYVSSSIYVLQCSAMHCKTLVCSWSPFKSECETGNLTKLCSCNAGGHCISIQNVTHRGKKKSSISSMSFDVCLPRLRVRNVFCVTNRKSNTNERL